MRIASLSDFLLQRIDRGGKAGTPRKAVNRQIYQVIREAILDQSLPAGLQLPSSRYLALELGVSRNTVTYAYDQLLAEGFLESRMGAGTFVADTEPERIAAAATPDRAGATPERDAGQRIHTGLSARGSQLVGLAGVGETQWGAFMPGVPDVTQFPNRIWSRLQNKYWRRSRADLLTYSCGGGYLPLREAIADYLRVARSVNCDASQILITTGIHQSIDLVARMVCDHGDHAWVEDPCYWGTRSVLRSVGVHTVAIPVDGEGMQLPLEDSRHPPRLIVATPSHQYPLGMVMSLARRRALLEYAAAHKAWIVEDDYDSEFRYGSRPIASLQGLDAHDRVLYLGTFSKTLFPGLRIGYLVVPGTLAESFATGLSELYRCGHTYTQAILTDFMTEGHFASHIRRMRLVYAERLRLLREAISFHFGDRIILTGGEAGLHLALGLPDHCDDIALCHAAGKEGIVVRPLSRYYLRPETARRGLMLGYGSVPDERIRPAFDILASVIKAHWPEWQAQAGRGVPALEPALG
ncbi:MocR-like pyridoxine biosynthesis transcription factor PdxR [Pseudoduganella namucuonensis]|uniref:Transcriptional regulator, GntR family n=1 Tax=Pseudoduganella namucuonensis TaxID=1035707 RepID=A0A1I7F0Y1_9BURK|nr:PLP-dependent aminotransferase family protein [Pseudoduganella namucuonensis]SFU29807.1 transcriptional regulator, GntR family [Pseudoduganella namucuonensis]